MRGICNLIINVHIKFFVIYRKARRKEKDSGGPSGGVGSGGPGGSDEGKLYLETALLERHLNETELQRLVLMPNGFEEHEWMASHSKFYSHISNSIHTQVSSVFTIYLIN